MLVLTRRIGERIFIGNDIVIMVTDVQGCSVKIGIEAPREVRIVREELLTEEKPDDPA
jgi:carbon storage regulator